MIRNGSALVVAVLIALPGLAGRLEAQGRRESIVVSGHWTLEVRNPDGTFVGRREFDNHLAATAGFVLGFLFTRDSTLGLYQIILGTSGEYLSPFGNNGDGPVSGVIGETSHDGPVAPGTLQHPTIPADGSAGFTLAGQASAIVGGSITDVSTAVDLCSVNQSPVAPRDCSDSRAALRHMPMTTTSIAPLRIEAGQVVDVTVTVRFITAPHPPSL